MKLFRNLFTKRPAVRTTRSTRPAFEQLESRELLSGNPVDVGAGVIRNVIGSQSSNPKYVATVNNTLYFTADDGVHGRELWRTDGTPANTCLVKDINPGPDGSFGGAVEDPGGHVVNVRGVATPSTIDADVLNYGNGCAHHWFLEKNR